MVSNSLGVTILCESLEMFGLPIVQSSFSFTDREGTAVPTTSLVHYFRSLRSAKTSLYGKKELNVPVLLEITRRLKNS